MITSTDLVTYLRGPASLVNSPALIQIVELTNALVEEVTGNLAAPSPKVDAIALGVAARAYRNPAGYASQTIGDVSWRLSYGGQRSGVYLTDAERGELRATIFGVWSDAPPWAGALPYRQLQS